MNRPRKGDVIMLEGELYRVTGERHDYRHGEYGYEIEPLEVVKQGEEVVVYEGFHIPQDADYLRRWVIVFQREDGRFDWHRVAPNNRVTCGSTQGYETRDAARDAAWLENPGLRLLEEEDERTSTG